MLNTPNQWTNRDMGPAALVFCVVVVVRMLDVERCCFCLHVTLCVDFNVACSIFSVLYYDFNYFCMKRKTKKNQR